MRNIVYAVVILLSAILNAQEDYSSITITNLNNSNLVIEGRTNICGFRCEFDADYLKENQEILVSKNETGLNFKNAVLALDTNGFDCGNKQMNRDFNALLKADSYPEIILELKTVETSNYTVIATAIIHIAGKTHLYKLPVIKTQTAETHFTGVLRLLLSDFELEFPKKLFGWIEVNDAIEIHFDIAAQFENLE